MTKYVTITEERHRELLLNKDERDIAVGALQRIVDCQHGLSAVVTCERAMREMHDLRGGGA